MIRICLIACCFILTFSSLWAESPKTVLLVNTFHWQFPWQQKITQGFMPEFKTLSAQSNQPVTLFVETLDRFKSKGSQEALFNYLSEKYASQKIDLIIANNFAALKFVDTHLWKALNTPQVLAFPGTPSIEGIKNIRNLGYITPGKMRFYDTLNLMTKLHPKTKKIVVVTGTSTNSLAFKDRVENVSRQLLSRPAMEFWTDITYDSLVRNAAGLTPGTLIFCLPFLIDGSGQRHVPAEVLKALAQVSPVPIYSAWDTFLGEGIVGGRLLSAEITGQILARRAFDILKGRPADQIRETPEDIHAFLFDQRQLDRFKIKAQLLPGGSRIKFQKLGIWDTHRGYVLSWIGLSTMALLMVLYRSNRNLKASKDKFRSLSDAAFEGVIISKEGKILEANRSMCRMLGYEVDELIGMDVINLAAPGHRTLVEAKITSGSGQIYEAEGQRKDGTVFPVEVHASEFQYRGKKVRVAAVRNMTEHRQARENLKERERLYKALFEKNISVMLLMDAQTGEIVDANPSACAFYGYTQDQLTRMKITDINTLPREKVLDEMEKARLEKRQYFNFRHCLASGDVRDVEVYTGPVEVWGRSLLCSVIHDVSVKKMAEKEREQLIANLKNALEEIKTLKGIVPICSHCKKIRDDKGYWNLLEAYIEKHSDASFSHGLCPDCSDQLYGDEDWYIKSRQKKS